MVSLLFSYLLESSICLILFLAIYKLLISDLTHFAYMRMYLLIALILSLVLPLVNMPIEWYLPFNSNELLVKSFLKNINLSESTDVDIAVINSNSKESLLSLQLAVIYGVLIIYIAGVLYKAYVYSRNLKSIYRIIKVNAKEKLDKYWIVKLDNQMPAFSFFNFIFINKKYKNMSNNDVGVITNHEKVHANQLHSLDIIFIEFIGIVFWFNPLMIYLRKSLQEIHEFIVDEKIAGEKDEKKAYAQLLLKLSSDTKQFSLATSFTGNRVIRRILMINKPRTSSLSKLKFLSLVPIAIVILLSLSCRNNSGLSSKTHSNHELVEVESYKLGEISWVGNHTYDDEVLSGKLKIDDYFSVDELNRCLDDSDISNLYMDNGYLFFNLEYSTIQKDNNVVDLIISIFEGNQAKIGSITIKGNKNVPTSDILDEITIKSGEVFSKAKLISSIRKIAKMDKFDPENIIPNVIPNPDKLTDGFAEVNFVIELTEIIKK